MSLKVTLRNWRLSLGKVLLDTEMSHDSQEHRVPKRLLFMRHDGKLGDYIVSSFSYREIKSFDPTIHIGVVCAQKDAYLYEKNPYIDALYFVRVKSIFDFFRLGSQLAKLNYDTVIDPTEILRNRNFLFLRLIKASHYIGYQKSNYKLFDHSIEGIQHYSELYKKILVELNIPVQDTTYDIPTDDEADSEIESFLRKNDIKDYIAINFFGASSSRVMSPDKIKQHIEYIQRQTSDTSIILLSYPDVYPALRVLSQLYSQVYVHQTKNIFHTVALIRRCRQLITVDTSTVHIGSGFNKAMIAWYRTEKSNFIQWGPKSKAETHVLFYKKTVNEMSPEAIQAEWFI
ncbi:MAG: glycosyltransferase family 9 protein [Alcaligenaceae bacterium]|nr:glycosyltransferase family 9 protein [Alcaligenaceae bacterium]